jgi:DNA-binding IscR family transcriptional regulator
MLDALYPAETRERAAAEMILEAASRGRVANVTTVARVARTDRATVLAVWARLAEAGLVPARGGDDGARIP